MSAPDAYLANFSDSGKRVLQGALDESCRRGQNYVSPAHILFALIEKETELFDSAVTNLSINSNSLRQAVENDLENSRRHSGRGFRISPETTKLFKVSMEKRRVIEASDILYVLITDKNSVLNNILRSGSEK
jgi:ATP-dependent Clp protease ATP-binding subunit ClpA